MKDASARVADNPQLGKKPDRVPPRVNLPPPRTKASIKHVVMVVVMPTLTAAEEGEKRIVATLVRRFVRTRSPNVRERVNEKGDMPTQDNGAKEAEEKC